jgi:hypothetical protein
MNFTKQSANFASATTNGLLRNAHVPAQGLPVCAAAAQPANPRAANAANVLYYTAHKLTNTLR